MYNTRRRTHYDARPPLTANKSPRVVGSGAVFTSRLFLCARTSFFSAFRIYRRAATADATQTSSVGQTVRFFFSSSVFCFFFFFIVGHHYCYIVQLTYRIIVCVCVCTYVYTRVKVVWGWSETRYDPPGNSSAIGSAVDLGVYPHIPVRVRVVHILKYLFINYVHTERTADLQMTHNGSQNAPLIPSIIITSYVT